MDRIMGKGSLQNGGGADLRTLFQNEGESPNLIPKTVRCEIRTWGRGLSQALICPTPKSAN